VRELSRLRELGHNALQVTNAIAVAAAEAFAANFPNDRVVPPFFVIAASVVVLCCVLVSTYYIHHEKAGTLLTKAPLGAVRFCNKQLRKRKLSVKKWICAMCQIPKGIFVTVSVLKSNPGCDNIKSQSSGIRKAKNIFGNENLRKSQKARQSVIFQYVRVGAPVHSAETIRR